MFIKFIARGQDIRIHFPLNVIRSVAESESSLLISHLNSASACKITIYSGNEELHYPISPMQRVACHANAFVWNKATAIPVLPSIASSFNSTVVCSLLTSTFHSTNGSFYYRVALKGGPSLPRCMNSPVWHLLMRPCTIRSACAVKVPRESVQERARVHLFPWLPSPMHCTHPPAGAGPNLSMHVRGKEVRLPGMPLVFQTGIFSSRCINSQFTQPM